MYWDLLQQEKGRSEKGQMIRCIQEEYIRSM